MPTRKSKSARRHTIKRKSSVKCSNESIVQTFLEILDMVKVYHWNTKSFSQHKATDELHGRLSENVDKFVETLLGKDASRLVSLNKRIRLIRLKNAVDVRQKMMAYRSYLMDMNKCLDKSADSDLLNIRDEILGDVNQFLYLLTLK